MTFGIYSDRDEDLIDDLSLPLNIVLPVDQPTVEMNALPQEEQERIRKMQYAGQVLAQMIQPRSTDKLEESKISPLPPVFSKVAKMANLSGLTPTKLDSILNMHVGSKKRDADTLSRIEKKALEKMEEEKEAEEFFNVAKNALEDAGAIPRTEDEILASLDETIQETVANAVPHVPFPNLAREIMHLGIGMERFQTVERLEKFKKEGDEHKAIIDKLLSLSAQLPRMNSDDGSYTLKQEAKDEIAKICKELEAKGIELFPGVNWDGEVVDGELVEYELTKEQLAAANSLINHHIDQNRTKLQELFTTKISVSIQFLQMMNEVMKKISELDDRAKRKSIEIQR